MQIITIPHPTLRAVAQAITKPSAELAHFIYGLEQTLRKTRNPRGVGLAAPQVDKRWRVFTTAVDQQPLTLINPRIASHSEALTLGPNTDDPVLEGCLSMPHLWGPVPRFQWVELEFETLEGQDRGDDAELQLVPQQRRFVDFFARVVQHELDHLDGILFTDHSLKYDLPVYLEDEKTKKAEEVERSFLELL